MRLSHRLMSSESIPVIVDFLQDKVQSVFSSVLIFALVVVYILRIGVFPLFLMNPLSAPTQSSPNLIPLARAWTPTYIGSLLYPSVAVSCKDAITGESLSGVNITVALSLSSSETIVWQSRYGFEGTIYDYTGLPISGRFSLPGFAPRIMLAPMASGLTSVTDVNGIAYFLALRFEFGLPGKYLMAAAPVNSADVTLLAGVEADFLSTAASISLLSVPLSRDNASYLIGDTLPPLTVRVSNLNGLGLAGHRVALISAPASMEEFSSLSMNPDLLLPRFSLFDAGTTISGLTDFDGVVTLFNVSVLSSMTTTVRAAFVCDGVLSPSFEFRVKQAPPRAAALHSPAPQATSLSTCTGGAAGLSPSEALLAPGKMVVRLLQVPSRSVLEGMALAVQPSVGVYWRVQTTQSGGGGVGGGACMLEVPIPGIQLMATIYKEQGVSNKQTLFPPTAAREISRVGATVDSVLYNVGQRKQLFNFISNATNAAGVASWTGLGFIRHGPSGIYSLTFAFAGIFFEGAATPDIAVNSSVGTVASLSASTRALLQQALGASYTAMQPYYGGAPGGALLPPSRVPNVTICTTCTYAVGASYGSPVYSSGIPGLGGPTNTTFPAGPSGYLPLPPAVSVLDATGNVLAGKAAVPIISRRDPLTGLLTAAQDIVVKEFPAPGTTTSVLSFARYSSSASDDGALAFLPHSIGLGDSDLQLVATARGHAGSFLRILTAPLGQTDNLVLQLQVEGVLSQEYIPLTVFNADRGVVGSRTCSYIDIEETPASIVQSFDQPYAQFANSSAMVFRAYNSLGVPLPDLNISLVSGGGFGFLIMQNSVGVGLFNWRTMDATFLAERGGTAAYAMGQGLTGGIFQYGLPPQLDVATTDASGGASFTFSGIMGGSNTYTR
jgi:hypothetical protein